MQASNSRNPALVKTCQPCFPHLTMPRVGPLGILDPPEYLGRLSVPLALWTFPWRTSIKHSTFSSNISNFRRS